MAFGIITLIKTKQINSVALIPQERYTDWTTASCRRNMLPTFVDRGVSRGQRSGSPTFVNLRFIYRSRYLFVKYLSLRNWVDPVPVPLLHKIIGSAGNRSKNIRVSSQELCPLDHTTTTGNNILNNKILIGTIKEIICWQIQILKILLWECIEKR
jgi:hypothetical protein